MKRIALFILSIFLTNVTGTFAQHNTKTARPKLVVGIVVDQMRWDYLYRFQERYGKGGFNRLMNEGFNCQNTMINYLPSFTAPGHTCIYTGSVPALHGVVANDWMDIRTGKEWYCTEDTTVKSVGGGKAGLMSPKNLLASTITDELRLATNFRSRTFGISIKDRGSILPAGHSANGAYWYDGETGNFITSSFYMQQLPEWVDGFNKRNLNDSLMKLDWNTLYPINTYKESIADDNVYEGATKGEAKPVFPHKTSIATDKGAIRSTPYGNTITRLMAQACIDGEQLGQKGETDFLAVSFSSTDYVGHQYAPNSIEIEDTYLRFDRDLELFLNYLDQKVGKGNYTVFLTADHGGAHNAKFLQDNKIPAKSVTIGKITKELNLFLQKKYGDSALVSSLMNYQVYMNEKAIQSHNLDREKVRAEIINWFRVQDGITNVLDLEHPDKSIVPEPLKTMVTNGYYPNRCGTIQIIMDPGWYSGYANTGTTHGSWNPYDIHIPLLWYGWGIKTGETSRTTHMTDIAATLAALLHIQAPNACVGEVIEEVRK
ncbi:MAG: alkaline phosphatase PafA [Taibaiella sp.]|jgi:predicted AlkP superfamily pyrophosphatase or phosphodiesterase